MLVKKTEAEIKLDGVLDEPAWQTAEKATGFFSNFPVDSLPPTFQSEAMITFDEHFLYVAFVCFDDEKKHIIQSLRRDIDWEGNDNIGIYLDPFNDFTNGFFFTITPMGVQSEGIISNGGVDDSFNDNWDNKWYSQVSRSADRWIAELAIPFKTLRYNTGSWNVTFLRNDVKRNEISSWIRTPIQYNPGSLAYSGKILWDSPLPQHKSNISVIPYISAASSQDKVNNNSDNAAQVGFDAKVALTPALNLDLTINPDFSQVEVDRQVINLTRFEFGFPERRQFFLENNDLFSQSGFPDTRPFFSRRIGLASDSTGNIAQVPILYGARVSGKLGENWRIGLLNMHTREKKSFGLPDQNYTVGVVQRQVFSRSNIGFIFVNKQSIGLGRYDSTRFYNRQLLRERIVNNDTLISLNRYNRVYGVDFNLFTKDNRWQGDIYYHRSHDGVSDSDQYSYGSFLGYFTRKLNVFMGHQGLGKNFNAETGFVPALSVYPGRFSGFTNVEYRFYPPSKKLALMGPNAGVDYVMTPNGTLTDRSFNIGYEFVFLSTSYFRVGFNNVFQLLPEDFNPLSPRGEANLTSGQAFTWNEFQIEYESDSRKQFSYELEASYGGFYNGSLVNVSAEFNYRYQPYGSLSVRSDYSYLDFGEAGTAAFFLVGPRLDLTFTDKLFLTPFVQYNDRSDNINLNARLQWRFQPASDFFLVYTENYVPSPLNSKNQALVLKFTYWLNL